jgi:hypothetical protein
MPHGSGMRKVCKFIQNLVCMLNPGAKGWIAKYLSMVKEGLISVDPARKCLDVNEPGVHMSLGSSGIIFGFSTHFLFLPEGIAQKWTRSEAYKVLYFESLLFIYVHRCTCQGLSVDSDDFVATLNDFFEQGGIEHSGSGWMELLRLSRPNKLEELIEERTKLPLSFDHKIWINYLQNSLSFLDVLLFDRFLDSGGKPLDLSELRERYTNACLHVLIAAAHADNHIERREEGLFDLFLASSHLDDKQKAIFRKEFREGIALKTIPDAGLLPNLFRRYLMDIAIFAVWTDTDFSMAEHHFIQEMADQLGFSEFDLNESFSVVESFVLYNQEILPHFRSIQNYDQVFARLSDRWSRIIMRNRDKLTQEIRESRELVYLVRKSAVEELTKEEKEKVKTQFKDIIRGIPALAIFMLPGGAILLPLILKLIPSLIPSAFRDNEISPEE